jgi:uncharacterized protein DUF6496
MTAYLDMEVAGLERRNEELAGAPRLSWLFTIARSAHALQVRLAEVAMAKYGKAASKNVESAMRRRKRGTLRSGSGRKVTSRKQAIAIGLSEARDKGAKVPSRKRSRRSSRSRTSKKR